MSKLNIVSPSREDVSLFQRRGWLGPYDVFSEQELAPVLRYLSEFSEVRWVQGQPVLSMLNWLYGEFSPRDHHLFSKPLADIFTDRRIVELLLPLTGEDLILWRSSFFCKLPEHGEIGWHQARENFWSGSPDHTRPTLSFPESHKDAPNLTVWLALEDADEENGCLRFADGSHRGGGFDVIEASRPAEAGLFAGIGAHTSVYQNGQRYSSEFDFQEEDWNISTVPAKAGQIIIFTENVMHSSLPNRSDRSRYAVNARYINPNVVLYPHQYRGEFRDQTGHNISRHYSVLVAGTAENSPNKIAQWHDLSELEIQFYETAGRIQFGNLSVPQDRRRLELESLYRQATLGDCESEEPDPVLSGQRYIEWHEWKKLEGLKSLECMKRYLRIADQCASEQVEQSDLEDWMKRRLAGHLGCEISEIDLSVSLEELGLDSAAVAALSADLEDRLNLPVDPSQVYELQSVEELLNHFERELAT